MKTKHCCPECGESGCAGHPVVKKKPYIFDKKLNRSIVAAEVVLGHRAVKRIINSLLDNVESNNVQNDEIMSSVADIFSLIDPQKQLVIKTDAGIVGGLTIKIKPKEVSIGDDMQGYTLIDIKTAIAEAIRDDVTGFILQALQLKWKRELTLGDAENITFHINKLIQLLK